MHLVLPVGLPDVPGLGGEEEETLRSSAAAEMLQSHVEASPCNPGTAVNSAVQCGPEVLGLQGDALTAPTCYPPHEKIHAPRLTCSWNCT